MKLNLSTKLSDALKNNALGKLLNKINKDKKTITIILIGIFGMLLVISVPSEKEDSKSEDFYIDNDYNTDNIQEEIETLIESIKGAGKTEVLITYESNTENVYAVNVDEKSDGSDLHYKSEYIITDEDKGLMLKVIYPKVRGVAVICEGGSDPIVKAKIYSVISALFDISTNKISVADMQ